MTPLFLAAESPPPETYPVGTIAYCGDGTLQAGEKCDLGQLNGVSGQNCTTTCQYLVVVSCGNGIKDAGEECDDGNTLAGDSCNAQCRVERGTCGDGSINSALGEQCDEGDLNGKKTSSCTVLCKKVRLPECGDGTVNTSREQCDLGIRNGNYPSTRCLDNCTLPYCGDGIVEVNEECDGGDILDGDGCDHTCRREDRAPSPVIATIIPAIPRETVADLYEVQKVPTPARTETGPGMLIFIISGAAAGIGLARRRFLRRR